MSGLDPLIEGRSLVVCVGPGGVGKTTTAAALALRAATQGKRAMVLTIDPARRLADALGLDGLDDAAHPVSLDRLRAQGESVGSLDAAMLDTKASYDALMRRVADEASLERIFANRAYQAFSRTMARSHAYVAMERLHHLVESGGYDFIVLDTPPTRSALDILDAPGRLASFLDERVVELFLSRGAEGRGASALRLLGRLAGESLVGELSEFFSVLAHLREGFAARARRVREILAEPSTAFVLVASPWASSLDDAAHLRDELAARDVALDALVFNRAYLPEPGHLDRPVGMRPETRSPSGEGFDIGGDASLGHLLEQLEANRAAITAQNAHAFAAIEGFGRAPISIALPHREGDIRDLAALSDLLRLQVALPRAAC